MIENLTGRVGQVVEALTSEGCRRIDMSVLRQFESAIDPDDIIFQVRENFSTGIFSFKFPFNPNETFVAGTLLRVTTKLTGNNFAAGNFSEGSILILSDSNVKEAIAKAKEEGIDIFID